MRKTPLWLILEPELKEIKATPSKIRSDPDISNFENDSFKIIIPNITTKIKYERDMKEEILGDKYFKDQKNRIEEDTSKKA